jgi:putative salt-induced outer membrane protein YdiY
MVLASPVALPLNAHAQSDDSSSVGPSEPWHPPATDETIPSTGYPEESLPAPVDSDGDLLVDDIIVPEQSGWYRPTHWFGGLPWDTGIELGINGSAGTSNSFSIQTGGYIKRESRFSKLDLEVDYNRTTSGGERTQNNAQLDVRNDWLLDDTSPWTLFGSGSVFYDEFQAFDLQVNGNSGVGYRFIHVPGINLIGRVGAGASREFGSPEDDWVPETLFGGEYSQQVSGTQKLSAKLDYFPELEEFGRYRLVAGVGWEIELVQPKNLSLKISATDRYDSTPNGAEPHLVNYSVLLLLKL